MKRLLASIKIVAILAAAVAFAFSPQVGAQAGAPAVPPAEPLNANAFRVAFFADTGFEDLDAAGQQYPYDYLDQSVGLPARAMKLVYAEGAELALHGGDIGYESAGPNIPARWDLMVTQILGADFPLLASAGNHDRQDWDSAAPDANGVSGPGYRTVLNDRYLAAEANPAVGPYLDCTFPTSPAQDIGQKGTCVYKDTITIVTVGLGERAPGAAIPTDFGVPDNSFEAYLDGALSSSTTAWTICNWHFNQSNLQTGFKSNEAGWKPYEYCRNAGALIATGHEHSYARTDLLGRFAEDMHAGDIVMTGPDLTVDEGATLAWVSGLGGRSIRGVSAYANGPWWAAQVNSTNQSSTHGAGVLFCDFNTMGPTGGNANAQCYFKTVDGVVHDRFELVSNANGAIGTFSSVEFCDGLAVTIDLNENSGVTGTPSNDVILGTPGTDTIYAGDGNDTICAGDGDDVIFAGAGNDRVFGEGGDDTISGDGNADYLVGGQGIDTIDGGDRADRIYGDEFTGGSAGGNDILTGGGGSDLIYGGPGDDDIDGGIGNDRLFGQQGVDRIEGGNGDDKIYGGLANDVLLGGNDRDKIWGETGHDEIYGNAGDDFHLDGDAHNDRVYGGEGADVVHGGDGRDRVYGQGGNDDVRAQTGDDWVTDGGPGIDSCQVAPGIDVPATNCE